MITYLCTVLGVKSVSCTGFIRVPSVYNIGGVMCRACTDVSLDRAFLRRVDRTKKRLRSGTRATTRVNYLTESLTAHAAAKQNRYKMRAHTRRATRCMETSTFLRESKNMLGERLMSQLHFRKYPLFIKNLVKELMKAFCVSKTMRSYVIY